MNISFHPDTHILLELADNAYEAGEVETPVDYVDAHFNEYPDSEKLYMDIQRIYESRCYR